MKQELNWGAKTVFWFYNNHFIYVWCGERSGEKQIWDWSEALVLILVRNCKTKKKESDNGMMGRDDWFKVKDKWEGGIKFDFLMTEMLCTETTIKGNFKREKNRKLILTNIEEEIFFLYSFKFSELDIRQICRIKL